MSTWVWFFRKWRAEDGKAIPDPVYLESHSGYRTMGRPGMIITPQGTLSLEDFLSQLMGKPVPSLGGDATRIREEELDTDIRNFSASTISALSGFLANEGIHLQDFVDHTDGLPGFSLKKIKKQDKLFNALEASLPSWREREDDAATSAVGLIETLALKLAQGYSVGISG